MKILEKQKQANGGEIIGMKSRQNQVRYRIKKGRDLYMPILKLKKVGRGLYPEFEEQIPLGPVKLRPRKKRKKS